MLVMNPAALLLLLIAVPITLLYVLRVRLRRAPVSSLMFWQQALADQPPRAFWQRFRHLFSWLLQMLLLLLLVLAAADLRWGISGNAQRVVIVLDVSASMSALTDGESRLHAAQRQALEVLSELTEEDEAAVVAAGPVPQILCGVTNHQPTLRRAIESAVQTPAAASVKAAVRLAQQLASGAAGGRVEVFSDGCGDAEDRRSPVQALQPDAASRTDSNVGTEVPTEYHLIGTALPNCGFTAFQIRRSDADPLAYDLFIRVRNAAAEPVTCRVELLRDGVPLDVIPVSIEAGGEWARVVSKLSAEGGRIQGELTEIEYGSAEDGLAFDNRAWAVLPARLRQRVLLVSSGSLFVQKVFEANPLVDLTVWRELPAEPVWPKDTVIVLHELVPAVLPPGPVLVLDPRSDCDLWKLTDIAADPVLETADAGSELMRNVRLEQVLIPEASRLEFRAAPKVLAGAGADLPLYVAIRRNGGEVLVLAVRLSGSDLAFRTVFPILVTNALNHFAGRGAEQPGALASGSAARIVLRMPAEQGADPAQDAGVRSVRLRSPEGIERRLRAVATADSGTNEADADSGWLVVTEPLMETGVWEFVADDRSPSAATAAATNAKPLAELAVNAAAESEVDLRPDTSAAVAAVGTGASTSRWFSGSATVWLGLLILTLLITDWALYQRRWLT
jgi:hypothetical protein